MNHHGIWVGCLDTLNNCCEYRTARAHHALGWIHDTLNGILHIRRRKGGAIVPLHALVQMKGNRLATVADLPGICQLGDEVQGHGVIRASTDQAVISRGDRRINATERGLMQIIEGDLFVTGTEEFTAIAGLFTVCGREGEGALASEFSVRFFHRLLGGSSQTHANDQHEPNPPPWSEEPVICHACISSLTGCEVCKSSSLLEVEGESCSMHGSCSMSTRTKKSCDPLYLVLGCAT